MTEDQRKDFVSSDKTLLSIKIDEYKLPSLLIKMIKTMKKNTVAFMTTTRIDKLHTNFKSDFLDQYTLFKEGDTVTFTVSLFGIETAAYFFKLKQTEKL